jgi:hypothetical protein
LHRHHGVWGFELLNPRIERLEPGFNRGDHCDSELDS